MPLLPLSLEDLRQMLRDAAGDPEGVDAEADILDMLFADLGYDSLALLETAGQIERRLGVSLADSVVTEATTPRALLDAVNSEIAAA